MVTSPCAICGSDDTVGLFSCREPNGLSEQPFALVRCRICGLVFIHPKRSAAELERFYFPEYYRKPPPGLARLIEGVVAWLADRRAAKVERLRRGRRILDIGCGDGAFLAAMRRRGWEAWGVETSQAGAERARQRPGLIIRAEPLSDCGFPEGHFDVVTLWHSLEHVGDPVAYLAEVRRVLSPAGVALIAVPNADSLEFRLFRGNWFHLDLPRHLYHFSPRTLARLLGRCGLELRQTSHFSWEYNPFGFMQSALNALSIEKNFLYRRLKGFKADPARPAAARAYDACVLALAGPPLAAVSFLYSLLSASLHSGGCLVAYAVRPDRATSPS
jgi:SAM-dependent methyltransferase